MARCMGSDAIHEFEDQEQLVAICLRHWRAGPEKSAVSVETKACELELKQVDTSQRTIEGSAAVFGTLDRAGDIIEPQAFDRTLKEQPDIAVFVGHKMNSLPVGEPIE